MAPVLQPLEALLKSTHSITLNSRPSESLVALGFALLDFGPLPLPYLASVLRLVPLPALLLQFFPSEPSKKNHSRRNKKGIQRIKWVIPRVDWSKIKPKSLSLASQRLAQKKIRTLHSTPGHRNRAFVSQDPVTGRGVLISPFSSRVLCEMGLREAVTHPSGRRIGVPVNESSPLSVPEAFPPAALRVSATTFESSAPLSTGVSSFSVPSSSTPSGPAASSPSKKQRYQTKQQRFVASLGSPTSLAQVLQQAQKKLRFDKNNFKVAQQSSSVTPIELHQYQLEISQLAKEIQSIRYDLRKRKQLVKKGWREDDYWWQQSLAILLDSATNTVILRSNDCISASASVLADNDLFDLHELISDSSPSVSPRSVSTTLVSNSLFHEHLHYQVLRLRGGARSKRTTSTPSAPVSQSTQSTSVASFATIRPSHDKYQSPAYPRPSYDEYAAFARPIIRLLLHLRRWTNLVLYLPWDRDVSWMLENRDEEQIITALHRDITGAGWYLLKSHWERRNETSPPTEPLSPELLSLILDYSFMANGGYTLLVWDNVNQYWLTYEGISTEADHHAPPVSARPLVRSELERVGVPAPVAAENVQKTAYGATGRTRNHLSPSYRNQNPNFRLYIALRHGHQIFHVFHSTLADPGTPMDPKTSREQRGATAIGEFLRIVYGRSHDNQALVTWLNNFAIRFNHDIAFPRPYPNLRFPTQHLLGIENMNATAEDNVELYLTSGVELKLFNPTPATQGRFYITNSEKMTLYGGRLNLPSGLRARTDRQPRVLTSVTFVEADVSNAISRVQAIDPSAVIVCRTPVIPPTDVQDPVWLMLLTEDDNGRLHFATLSQEHDSAAHTQLTWNHIRDYLFGNFRFAAHEVSVQMAKNRELLRG